MSTDDSNTVPKTNLKLRKIQTSNKTRFTASAEGKYEAIGNTDDHMTKGKKRYLPKKEDAECLSKAIQRNIVALVNNMPFTESFIPDELIAEGCITEDECKVVRERKERKDQVRKVVNLIKDRNFTTIKNFLNVIGKENNCPTIVTEIWGHYNDFLKINAIAEGCCGVCKVKAHVDVKYVMDVLWQWKAISDPLYERLCESENVKGNQDDLWNSIFEEFKKNKKLEILNVALESKGHYTHIAKELRTQSSLGTRIGCACLRQDGTCTSSQSSLDSITTYLPNSSLSSVTFNETNDTEEAEMHAPEDSINNKDKHTSSETVIRPEHVRLNANVLEAVERDINEMDKSSFLSCCFPVSTDGQ